MEAKYTSRNSKECQELEEAVKDLFANCTIVGKNITGMHYEKTSMHIGVKPNTGSIDTVAINKSIPNNPARIIISAPDRTYVEIGKNTFFIEYTA